MDGVLNIDKPAGPTSHDIVLRVRRILGEKRVGHAGTLDPMATGVLVVCIGKATRIVEYLVAQEKEYVAEMALGRTTTTQDATGEELSASDSSFVTREIVEEVLPRFTGRIMQIPPMVSAVKHQGKRLYELARKDIEVERKPREVTVYSVEITSFTCKPDDRGELDGQGHPCPRPIVGLRVVCSSGTYIRTLCADIGEALGVGGYMQSLVRTRVGRFDLERATQLDELERAAAESRADDLIIPMDEALSDIPAVTADRMQSGLIVHGGAIPSALSAPDGTLVRVRSDSGELLAVGRVHPREVGSVVTPEKVFAEAAS